MNAIYSDFTDFGDDWRAALDEAGRWGHDCTVTREYSNGCGGSWLVTYRGDVNAIEVS